eukprot:TRINITY_DN2978_c0_g2_i1.p1 TRINITY_DN2978_c0_g2~~TRINITY_DN2978_c0_g2_i1.p1  ORF type:complete len:296 (-),score=76.19 TRINITY_DN2978_c0_g2_i1:290-1177(-)
MSSVSFLTLLGVLFSFADGRQRLGLPPISLREESFASVVTASQGQAEEWIVFFGVPWSEGSAELLRHFRHFGRKFESRLNAHRSFSEAVRFAEVDCAADKILCNQQGIESYPTVIHYMNGERAEAWYGKSGFDVPKLEMDLAFLKNWLDLRLGDDRALGGPKDALIQDYSDVEKLLKEELLHIEGLEPVPIGVVASSLIMAWMMCVAYGFLSAPSELQKDNAQYEAELAAEIAEAEKEAVEADVAAAEADAMADAIASEVPQVMQQVVKSGDSASCRMARRIPQAWAMERKAFSI